MLSDPSAIGIMEGAYFVSKTELLEWLRTDFGIEISKIEECGNGVTYLRILDKMFPGKVPIRKVKIHAKQEWECLHNLKILQSVFTDQKIHKHLDIDRLAKCMYLDNLEFLQWIKRFYDRNYVEQEGFGRSVYDETSTVSYGSPSDGLQLGQIKASDRPYTGQMSGTPINARNKVVSRSGMTKTTAVISNNASTRNRPITNNPSNGTLSYGLPTTTTQTPIGSLRKPVGSRKEMDNLTEEIQRLKQVLEEKNQELLELQEEKEGKLRKLEVMTEEEGRRAFSIEEVQEILFTEEDIGKDLICDLVKDSSTSQENNQPLGKCCDIAETTTTSATGSTELGLY